MKLLISLTVMVFFLLSNSGLAFQNEPDGFRGLKWGDPPIEDMMLVGKKEDQRVYQLPKEKMYLGDAQFYLILYTFFNSSERFMGAGLYFKEEENFDLLKTICRGKFGKETEEGFYELAWEGLTSIIFLNYDFAEEKGYLALNSTIIFSEYLKAKEQREIKRAEEDW